MFICIVPLNYPLSLGNVPLNLTICYIYIYMYCPLKLPFFIKNVSLNFTIRYMHLSTLYCPLKLPFFKKCPLKFDNLSCIFTCINTFCQYINVQQTVLYLTIFLPHEWTFVFYYNPRTRSACLSRISSSR